MKDIDENPCAAGRAPLPDPVPLGDPGPNADFAHVADGLPPAVARLKEAGRLAEARRLIGLLLGRGDQPYLAAALRAELVRLDRLPREFCVGRARAIEDVRAEWPAFDGARLDALVDAGRVDWRYIEGEQRFLADFIDSLRKYTADAPGLASADSGEDEARDRMVARMRAEGAVELRTTLRARVEATVPVAPDALVHAWLPLPAACPQQDGIEVLSATPGAEFASLDAPQRTAHWCVRGTSSFEVVYRYTHRAVWHDAYAAADDPALAAACAPLPDDARACLGERAPHIVFTPLLRSIAREVTAGCVTALQKARAVYDYVTRNVDYRFVPAYVVLDSIADGCARSLRGDCGVMALLFIALCRIAGVPARWQSGLYTRPDRLEDGRCMASGHDWAMFYAEPFGWLFVDCSFGSGARRAGSEERRRHYFGNLDPWRMVANSEYYAPLTPPDAALREDPYDNQRGEMSVDGVGLTGYEMSRPVELLECQG